MIIAFFAIIKTINTCFLTKYKNENNWLRTKLPLVVAHAGGRDLNPENTMKAFRYAYSIGVDVLELDLMMTADSVLVTHHGTNEDGDISLFSDGFGLVRNMTYQELQEFNFGYKFKDLNGNLPYKNIFNKDILNLGLNIPKLEDLFLEFGDSIKYLIEIKSDFGFWGDKVVNKVVLLVDRYSLGNNVMIGAFDHRIAQSLINNETGMQYYASQKTTIDFVIKNMVQISWLFNPEMYSALMLPASWEHNLFGKLDLSKNYLIKKAHKMNMAVYYWTINDLEVMAKLINKGVDGIITDRPDIMIEALKESIFKNLTK